jgi:Ras-related protein Rab-18
MENKKKIYKIVIMGDTCSGKSTLIRNYLDNDIKNISPTIGLEFYSTIKFIEEKNIKYNFYDTSGNPAYNNISKNYLKNYDALIIVFDISKVNDFNNGTLYNLKKKLFEYNKNFLNFPMLLIGNKINIKNIKNINNEIIQKFALNNSMIYYEIDIIKSKNTLIDIMDNFLNYIYNNNNTSIFINNNIKNNDDMTKINFIPKDKKTCCTIL